MLDVLLKEIEKEIDKEKNKIKEQADKEIQNINKNTNMLMNEIKENEETKLQRQQAKYDKHINRKLENAKRKHLQEAHLKYSQEIFNYIKQHFSKIEEEDIYPKILQKYCRICEEIYKKHCGIHPIIMLNPKDINYLKGFTPDGATLKGNENVIRGVEFHDPDNKIIVHNSMDSRFEKGKDKFLQLIHKTLKSK